MDDFLAKIKFALATYLDDDTTFVVKPLLATATQWQYILVASSDTLEKLGVSKKKVSGDGYLFLLQEVLTGLAMKKGYNKQIVIETEGYDGR